MRATAMREGLELLADLARRVTIAGIGLVAVEPDCDHSGSTAILAAQHQMNHIVHVLHARTPA